MNGQSIVELSHDNIVQLIKDAGVTVTLTVVAEEGKEPGTSPCTSLCERHEWWPFLHVLEKQAPRRERDWSYFSDLIFLK